MSSSAEGPGSGASAAGRHSADRADGPRTGEPADRSADVRSSAGRPDTVPAPEGAQAGSAASRLFDLRGIIAVLFGIYGAVLTLLGLVATSQADLDKAGGTNVNLWSGIGMLVLAALFVAWVVLRPLRMPTQAEAAASPAAH